MRIGELSRATGIAASRIRFYERHGLLPKAARGENGYRWYASGAAKRLGLIDQAQKLGFSLSEIRDALSEGTPEMPPHATIIRALRAKLSSIEAHIREAQARRRELLRLLAEMGASADGGVAAVDAATAVAEQDG